MELLYALKSLILLDVKSLMGVLVWGDFALAALSFSYHKFHYTSGEKNQIMKFGFSKLMQSFAWLFLFLRGDIPDILSIYLGNSLLYFSIYLESNIMLKMIEGLSKRWYKVQRGILGIALFSFVICEVNIGNSNVRIAISSLSILLFFICPTLIYVLDKKGSAFKRYLGTNLVIFLIVLFIRAVQSLLFEELNLFTNNMFQSITFITLILLMFINGAGFLLLMYESTDLLIKSIADLDPLTQISNRRNFMLKAGAYFERHKKVQKAVALLFIDIDRFKKINDTYGHLVGDEILKKVANNISDNIRPMDLCCRYGGEEFVIFLYEADESQAVMIAERIRKGMKTGLLYEGRTITYTISVGIYSEIPDEEMKLEKFIDFSDKAMYIAKKEGRDRVICYKESYQTENGKECK
ncbi:MAG: GGDEF domain-containing protein [Lachnospiraceae bacterium]|nr:GGDEF domain-containing protein [Lachnospiraceae bacterium]